MADKNEKSLSDILEKIDSEKKVGLEFEYPKGQFVLTADREDAVAFSPRPTYMPRFTEASERFNRGESIVPDRSDDDTVLPEDSGAATMEFPETDPESALHVDISVRSSEIVSEPFETVFSLDKSAEPEPESAPLSAEEIVLNGISSLEDLSVSDTEQTDEIRAENAETTEIADPIPEKPSEAVGKWPENEETIPEPSEDTERTDFPNTFSYSAKDLYGEPEETQDAPVSDEGKGTSYRKGSEFTAYSQRDGFKDRFLDQIFASRVRMIFSSVIALLMLVFECLTAFSKNPSVLWRVESFPSAIAWMDLFFVVCLFLCILPETFAGFGALFRGESANEPYYFLLFLTVGLYDLLSAIFRFENVPLFGAVFGIAAVLVTVGRNRSRIAEFSSFKLVSSQGEKIVADLKRTRDLSEENFALDGAVDAFSSHTVRTFRTDFVSDFFARIGRRASYKRGRFPFAPLCLTVSLVCGTVGYFVGGGFMTALISFTSSVLLTAPIFLLTSHYFSYAAAESMASDGNSTIVGEGAMTEYSAANVLVFDDSDVFGNDDVVLKKISLFCTEEKFEKVARRLLSLFAPIGGPLFALFSETFEGKYAPAAEFSIEDDGCSATVSGHKVLAGTRAYMIRNGIDVSGVSLQDQDTTRILLTAEDGFLTAQMSIRYSFSESFTRMIPQLRKYGFTALIYTRDPSIGNELVMKLTMGADVIRVLKKKTPKPQSEPVYPALSSPFVTVRSAENIVSMILLSRRFARFENEIVPKYAVAFSVLGSAVALGFSLTANLFVPQIPVLLLWQALFFGIYTALLAFFFPKAKHQEKS